MNNNLQKNFDAVDLFKFIGSIMIFVMHVDALNDFGAQWTFAWELLTRWAIPFFFIASSFFLFLNGKDNLMYACKKYIKRILLLYCAWFIINIPSIFEIRLYHNNLFSVNTWLIFLKNSILSSTFTGSWFFVSCIFCSIFIVYFCRNLSKRETLLLTGVLQLLCIFTSVWGGVFSVKVREILTFFCFPLNMIGGSFYFAIGKYLAENYDSIRSFGIQRSVLLFVASCVLYVAEVLIAKKTGLYCTTDYSFFVVLFGIFAFIMAVNLNCTLKGKAKELRKASTVIFCAQSNLLIIKSKTASLISSIDPDFKFTSLVSFGVVLILMFLVVLIVFKLQSKKIKYVAYLT